MKFEEELTKNNIKYAKLEEKDGYKYLISSEYDLYLTNLHEDLRHELEYRDDYNTLMIKIFN